jgi:hypothetical protein
MATTTVTPPASAPAAAAPSAAPSTPVSTPSTPVTPTPAPVVSTPESTGPLDSGDSLESKILAGWQKVKAESVTPETPAAEKPAEAAPVTTEPEAVVPAVVAEPEVKPEVKVEEKPAAPDFTIDASEFEDGLAPADFAKAISTDPAVTKFFDANPAVKGQVFAALRRDAENREIRQIIPDVDTAKTVVGVAGTYQKFDNAFLSAEHDNAQGFTNHLMTEARIIGEDGKPVLDAAGNPTFHPALGIFLRKTRDDANKWSFSEIEKTGKIPENLSPILDALQKHATSTGNERVQAAVNALREEAGSAPSSPSDALPEELKPFADKLQRDRAALDKEKADAARTREESAKVANQQAIDRAEVSAIDAIARQLWPKLTEAGLSEFERTAAWSLICEKLDAALEADQLYGPVRDNILLGEPGDKREAKHRAHILKYAAPHVPRVMTEVLRMAKSGALTRQAAKDTKVEEQRKVSATDPKGTSIAPASLTAQTPHQMRTEIIKAYQDAHNGESPTMEHVFAEEFKRMGVFQRKPA